MLRKVLVTDDFIGRWIYRKKITEIYHNHIIKDFVGIEKIVSKYL